MTLGLPDMIWCIVSRSRDRDLGVSAAWGPSPRDSLEAVRESDAILA